MIMCKTCRIPFEEGAQFCNSCGGFVDYVGVREGADAEAAAAAGVAVAAPAGPDTGQMAIAASAAATAEAQALADAAAQDRERAEAQSRAAAAAAAEQQARATAATAADAEAKARAEEEARAQAAAKAKAEGEAAEAAKAAEASRRAAAMVAKPATPTPRRPEAPVVAQPAPTAPAEPKAPVAPKPAAPVTESLQEGETPCAQCGAGNPPSRNFCRKCGAQLRQAAPVAVAAAPRVPGSFMSRLKQPTTVVALVVGLAVAGYFMFLRDDDKGGIRFPTTTEATTPEEGPREVTEQVTVDATQPYTDTGIELAVGDRVVIVAEGEAESGGGPSGPEGDPNPNFRGANVVDGGHNGLIAKIGVRGDPFFVGPRLVFDAEEAGTLFLGMNDTGVDNNAGAYEAEITVS